MFIPTTSLATLAVIAVGTGSATALAADTANVTPQTTLKAGQISPIRIPGRVGRAHPGRLVSDQPGSGAAP